jgi:hypothetical protein
MWIYNNYLKLKEAYRIKIKDESLNNEITESNYVNELENGSISKQELIVRENNNLKNIQNYELEYDRTLYTILYSLQQRQDSKDL